jgi:hypothetical protein
MHGFTDREPHRHLTLTMTTRQALVFIRKHGVVLESARGPAPSLAEAIVGAPVRGRWWSHAKGREIFAITRAVRDSEDVLVCRLVHDRITFVHRRMWPALVRLGKGFPPQRLARLREVHTSSGQHVTKEIPFPDWVPPAVNAAGRRLSEEAAREELAEFLP